MKKQLLMKTFLMVVGLLMGMCVWAGQTSTISFPDGWGGTDINLMSKGGTLHFKFTQTNVKDDELWRGFAIVVQNTAGTDLAVLRCDNWNNTAGSNVGFDTALPAGWADKTDGKCVNFDAIKENSIVDMTISYSAEGEFKMVSSITPGNGGEAFKYNFTKTIDGNPDQIKVGLFADNAVLTLTRYPSTSKKVMANGSSIHYNFTQQTVASSNWFGFILDADKPSGTRIIGVRQDNYELENSADHWAGLEKSWDWEEAGLNFASKMNGATVDMDITFIDGVFKMSSLFYCSDGKILTYKYTKDLQSTNDITVYLEEDFCKITVNDATYNSPAAIPVTVTNVGFATYVPSYDLNFSATGIKAYKVKVASKGIATLTQVNNVPAGTPVFLYKDGGATENIPVMTGAAAVTENDLVAGTNATVATTDGDYTNMILNNGSEGIGFYFAAGKTVAANRAYLHIASTLAPDPVGSAPMMLVFADDLTGIKTVKSEGLTVNGYYDLQGRRVAQPTKGLYIVNGRKVVIK